MKIEEAEAWIKKYFIAASDESVFLLLIIRGTKDNIFNSKPIQAVNQFVDEIETEVPRIVISKNKRFRLFKINKVYCIKITLWCIGTKDFDSLRIFSLFNVIKIHSVYDLSYQDNPFYQALYFKIL